MSAIDLATYRTAALSALAAGNYDLAIANAMAAKLILGTMADASMGGQGGGEHSLSWRNAASVDSFIADCRRLASESNLGTNPFQQTKVKYVRDADAGAFA